MSWAATPSRSRARSTTSGASPTRWSRRRRASEEAPMGAAYDMGRTSMAKAEAKDRQGWLALFAPDAVVQDPVGPSVFDPEGTGHRGIEAITAFYDNVISTSEQVRFEMRQWAEGGDE